MPTAAHGDRAVPSVNASRLCAGVVLLALFLPSMAAAQDTGSVRGQVVDAKGGPLAGAVVTVTDAAGGSPHGSVADGSGRFVVGPLPAGRGYVLRAEFPGYASTRLTDLEIAPGRATPVRVILQPREGYRESIEVRARPSIVTLDESTGETRFSAEFIESLPIFGRNYQDVLSLAPGVTDIDGDGNPNIHGARDTGVVTLVDGVSTTDPLTGKFGAQLNIEAIQEIEVLTSAVTAQYGRAQGGFANIVTKSGGNEFAGTFKFIWRSSILDGDGAGIDDPSLHAGIGERGLRDLTFHDFKPFLSLEGPIRRDHAWYYMAHEYIRRDDPQNAVSAAFVVGTREFREFLKLTWQASLNHRLALSLNYDPQEYLNQGLNSFTREESGYVVRQGGPILTLRATSVLNPNASLDTALSTFDERPARVPNLDADTNGNGILTIDRNGNGFIEARERDPGEDYDGDGLFDVFEDFLRENGRLDPGEDRDGDRRLTPAHGCEGLLREDDDCDGHLDDVPEIDVDGDGYLDWDEDRDHDLHRDAGTEDRNGNHDLDDAPAPDDPYPYGRSRPTPSDRDYTIDQQRGLISGPFFLDFSDRRRRVTLKQDLGLYVPDYWGSHDVKVGYVFEREAFDRRTETRAIVAPIIRDAREGRPSTVRTVLPSDREVVGEAAGLATGLYVQENWKPFPNLSVGFGLRYDRERLDSFGYTPFDPQAERALYDRVTALIGREAGRGDDLVEGDANGYVSRGIGSDPIFFNSPVGIARAIAPYTDPLTIAATARLTRHHTATRFTAPALALLFPEILSGGEVDPEALARHGVLAQQRERFAVTNDNLAPRLAVSWDPSAAGRTKLYATWGRYYDKLFLSSIVGEEGPDPINRYYVIDSDGVSGSGLPNRGIGAPLSIAPPSATQVDRDLQTPFSDELTLGFEREIIPELAIGLRYVNRRYRDQLQDVDINHTTRTNPATGQPFDQLGAVEIEVSGQEGLPRTMRQPDGRPDLFIRNFFFNQVLRVGNANEASYRAFELELVKRLARRWEMQTSYTYSRALGAAEDFQSSLGDDPSTVETEFGYLDYDQRHVVKFNLSAFLPRDWQVGTAITWSSGLPYSVISRFFALDNADYQQFRTRYGTVERRADRWEFEPRRRNSERNEPIYDVNLRARKGLIVAGHSAAIFLEVFNALNTDDLRIVSYDPAPLVGFDIDNPTAQGRLQLDATRRFGRRFQIGFQVDF